VTSKAACKYLHGCATVARCSDASRVMLGVLFLPFGDVSADATGMWRRVLDQKGAKTAAIRFTARHWKTWLGRRIRPVDIPLERMAACPELGAFLGLLRMTALGGMAGRRWQMKKRWSWIEAPAWRRVSPCPVMAPKRRLLELADWSARWGEADAP